MNLAISNFQGKWKIAQDSGWFEIAKLSSQFMTKFEKARHLRYLDSG